MVMERTLLHILMFGGEQSRLERIQGHMTDCPEYVFAVKWALDLNQIALSLRRCAFDVIVLDLSSMDSVSPVSDAMSRLRRWATIVPVIVIVDSRDEAKGMASVEAGAQDYLFMESLDRTDLIRSILRSVARKKTERRLRLVSETAGRLLEVDDPQAVVESLCREIMLSLGCQIYINCLVSPHDGRLVLNGCSGILPEEIQQMHWLDSQESICGFVARTGERVVVEDLGNTHGHGFGRTRNLGVKALCCNPLRAKGALIGTLTFASKIIRRFPEADLELMEQVSDQVAVALQRKQAEKELVELNRRLEERVWERTVKLAKTETMYRGLVENSFDLLCLMDAEGIVRYITPQIHRYGLVPADLEGHHFGKWIHDEDRQKTVEEFNSTMKTGELLASQFRVVLPDLRVCWFEGRSTVQYDIGGRIEGMTTVMRDISETILHDQVLRESEERYRTLFNSESVAILVFDVDSHAFIDVNPRAQNLYGYSHEEFLQMGYGNVAVEPGEALRLVEEAAAGTCPQMRLGQHRRRDGSAMSVETSASILALGSRKAVCAVVLDVSRRVAQEREIDRNREELRRLASELSLANQRERQRIAGELHDGLSQLLSSAYLRLDVLNLGPMPAASADSIRKVCEIVATALNQVRTLTFDLSCPMLDELGLSAALEELCYSMSNDYAIQFEFRGGSFPVLPLKHEVQMALYRAARELLINVMKHSSATAAYVNLELEDGCVRLGVCDDGKGFDAAMAGRGFSHGGGFGLFNIGEYVQHVGGSLSIRSDPDGGTEVSISIPLEEKDHG